MNAIFLIVSLMLVFLCLLVGLGCQSVKKKSAANSGLSSISCQASEDCPFHGQHCLNGQCVDSQLEECLNDFQCGPFDRCSEYRCVRDEPRNGNYDDDDDGGADDEGTGPPSSSPRLDRGRTGNARHLSPNGEMCYLSAHEDTIRPGSPSLCIISRDSFSLALDFVRYEQCTIGKMLYYFESTINYTCQGKWKAESSWLDPITTDSDGDGIDDFGDFCRDTPADGRIWKYGKYSGCSEGQRRDSGWRSRTSR